MDIDYIMMMVMPIMVAIVVIIVFIVPIVTDLYQSNKNKEVYGEYLNNYDLDRKFQCKSFCGSEEVRFIPSRIFAQEVCQCKPGVD